MAIPHSVLASENYAKLSHKAVKLLIDLSAQIVHRQGKEATNGNLCAALKIMKPLGWKSSDTLDAAEAELLHFGFIEVTQKGNRRHPTLYAVTFIAIDSFDAKPWIKSTNTPSGKWRQKADQLPPRRYKRKKLIPENWATPYSTIGLVDQIMNSLYPPIGLLTLKTDTSDTRQLGTSIDLPCVPETMKRWAGRGMLNLRLSQYDLGSSSPVGIL